MVRLTLDPVEAAVLRAVIDDLADSLDGDVLAPDDPVRQRLFPSGSRDDATADAQFRSMTETSLRLERTERARQCSEQLRVGGVARLELDAEAGTRWIQVLNDLRLAIGTRLDVSEADPDPVDGDPDFAQRSLYHWLTWLQESLVRALTA